MGVVVGWSATVVMQVDYGDKFIAENWEQGNDC